MIIPRFYQTSEHTFFNLSAADQRRLVAEAKQATSSDDDTIGRNPSARWLQVMEAKKAFRAKAEAIEAENRAAQRESVKPHQPPPTQAQRLQAVAASAKTGQGSITASEANAFLASLPPVPHA